MKTAPAQVILVMNTGSSSIKFSLYLKKISPELIYHGEIENIFAAPHFMVFDENHKPIMEQNNLPTGYETVLKILFDWITRSLQTFSLTAVGHRIVHGGQEFISPTKINRDIINQLEKYIPLAPLHQPYNLEVIKIITTLYPLLLQVACFDTAFHHTQLQLATQFALPKKLTNDGIMRYGFHGLSYEYIASVLPSYFPEQANSRVIVAHLGSGASMCAMHERKSIATSMGMTALDGLMMGTRCGNIDPGVILYLLQEKNYSLDMMITLLYKQSGLLGVSGISNDMRILLENNSSDAVNAIDLFCYQAAKEFCSLMVPLQGCDVLIFTAGIGENAAMIRKKICDNLSWLGIIIDEHENMKNATIISEKNSKILVAVIPTNEELMLARHVYDLMNL